MPIDHSILLRDSCTLNHKDTWRVLRLLPYIGYLGVSRLLFRVRDVALDQSRSVEVLLILRANPEIPNPIA